MSEIDSEPGDEIARQFRRGSAEAVGVVRRRVRRILSFRGYGLAPEDRHDLEQEVMTQLWQAVNRAGFSGSRFWGFVEVVTARRSIDWLRGRKPLTALEHEPPSTARGPLAAALAQEGTEMAHAALAQLAKPCRDLIYLHFALGKPYRELSGLLGKSEGALRVQLHRCVTEARRILAGMRAGAGPGAAGAESR
jgi:RNA polymerase sigma factor (sigma-70 family)